MVEYASTIHWSLMHAFVLALPVFCAGALTVCFLGNWPADLLRWLRSGYGR